MADDGTLITPFTRHMHSLHMSSICSFGAAEKRGVPDECGGKQQRNLVLNVSTASRKRPVCGVAKFEIEIVHTRPVQYVEILPVVRRLAVNSFSLSDQKQETEAAQHSKNGTPSSAKEHSER